MHPTRPGAPLAKYLGGVSEVLANYAHFFFLSSGTAWERRQRLMLTSTFIAAWRLGEGLPTPNLRRGQDQGGVQDQAGVQARCRRTKNLG